MGALVVTRKHARASSRRRWSTCSQTFATQSALAIQNARLFREIEHKSRQLETAEPAQVRVPRQHVATSCARR